MKCKDCEYFYHTKVIKIDVRPKWLKRMTVDYYCAPRGKYERCKPNAVSSNCAYFEDKRMYRKWYQFWK